MVQKFINLKQKILKCSNSIMSRKHFKRNETRHIKWHKTWAEDKCRCECKELIDKGICE